jgi:hypothetical protein
MKKQETAEETVDQSPSFAVQDNWLLELMTMLQRRPDLGDYKSAEFMIASENTHSDFIDTVNGDRKNTDEHLRALARHMLVTMLPLVTSGHFETLMEQESKNLSERLEGQLYPFCQPGMSSAIMLAVSVKEGKEIKPSSASIPATFPGVPTSIAPSLLPDWKSSGPAPAAAIVPGE